MSLRDSGLLIKGIAHIIENETKKQRDGFLGVSLDTLDASLLENRLAGKGVIRADDGVTRAGQDF